MNTIRSKEQQYPDYSAEIRAINEQGVSVDLLQRILEKHIPNAEFNRSLYERYQALDTCVPIFNRTPRFSDENGSAEPINNKINHDFFGEIVDFKTGYFAGKPVNYSYSTAKESEETTGSKEAVEKAAKALTDFVSRNNMYDKDMEMTKHASICGYCGRLFYIDLEGNERCRIIPGYETILLSSTDLCEPEYAVRYYSTTDLDDNEIWKVEFYDQDTIYFYEGELDSLTESEPSKPHLFDGCPLQGIVNNREMLGDAERVLTLIDAYDRTVSDNSNDVESFSSAYMVFENMMFSDEEMEKAQSSGAIQFKTGPNGGKVYYLTKDVNDSFSEHHLDRLEDNIYRFSKTPNLGDETFGTSSGVSLKFKLTALESKCGMFQAKVASAGTYMFRLLASSWRKKQINVDPLQCIMEFSRNFPLDLLSEAQAAQALIHAGVPKEVAFSLSLSAVDDIDYVMQLIEEEQNGIPSLTDGEEST